MRALLALVAAVALVAAAGACGSTITVPDQGVIVLACSPPNYCYRADCACTRAAAMPGGGCDVPTNNCTSDNATCNCPDNVQVSPATDAGPAVTTDVACKETAAACVGRGVLCAMNNNCQPVGSTCNNQNGVPPELVPPPGGGSGPALEPHCPFVDDVCCPGPAVADMGTTD